MLIFTHDKRKLLRHFRKDEVLFAYHIGDLDDFYFPHCQWAALFNRRTGIDDVLLTYTGGDTPSLLAFAQSERFAELLHDYLPIAPRQFFCHFQNEYRGVFAEFGHEKPLGTHLKMKLNKRTFAGLKTEHGDDHDIARLAEADEEDVRALYAEAYPESYFVPRMLQTGKYLGVRDNGRLIAVVGVHVSSDQDRIAVLGNLATHPDHRGRGLATRLMRRITGELVDEDKMVCLNVKEDNAPAITCYEKLGFERVHQYEEAFFTLR